MIREPTPSPCRRKRARRHECRCHRWRRRAGCTGASLRLGSLDAATFGSGDRLQFDLTVDGVRRTVTVALPRPRTRVRSRRRCRARSTRRWAVAGCGSPPGRTARSPSPRPARERGASLAVANIAVSDGNGTVTGTGGLSPQSAYSSTQATIGGQSRTFALGSFSLSGRRQHRSAAPADRRPRRRSGRLRTIDVQLAGVTDTTSMAAAINAAICSRSDLWRVCRRHRRRRRGRRLPEDQRQHPGLLHHGIDETAPPSAIAVCAPDRRAEPRRWRNTRGLHHGSDFEGPVTIRRRRNTALPISCATAIHHGHHHEGGRRQCAGLGCRLRSVERNDRRCAALARVVAEAMRRAGIGDVSVAASGRRLQFTATGPSADGDTLELRNVQSPIVRRNAGHSDDRQRSRRTAGSRRKPVDLLRTLGGRRPGTLVTLDRGTIEAALGTDAGFSAGRIEDADQLARVVRQALAEAGVAGVDVVASANRLRFTKAVAGSGSLALAGVTLRAPARRFPQDHAHDARSDVEALAALDEGRFLQHVDAIASNIAVLVARVIEAEDYVGHVGSQLRIQSSFSARLEGIYRDAFRTMAEVDMNGEQARLKALVDAARTPETRPVDHGRVETEPAPAVPGLGTRGSGPVASSAAAASEAVLPVRLALACAGQRDSDARAGTTRPPIVSCPRGGTSVRAGGGSPTGPARRSRSSIAKRCAGTRGPDWRRRPPLRVPTNDHEQTTVTSTLRIQP